MFKKHNQRSTSSQFLHAEQREHVSRRHLLAVVIAGLVTTTAMADLNINKIHEVFKGNEIVKQEEIKPGFYEVQLKSNESLFERSVFYTNENADYFVTSEENVFKTNDDGDVVAVTPDFAYDKIDLTKHATFVSGTGEPRFVFVNPFTEKGFKGLRDILEDTKNMNYVYIHFEKDQSTQKKLIVPVFFGDNSKRVETTKKFIKLFKDFRYQKILLRDVLTEMKKVKNDNEDETLQRLKASMELSGLIANKPDFVAYNLEKDDVTPELTSIPQKTQTIKEFDFRIYGTEMNKALANAQMYKKYDFSKVEGFDQMIEDATAYKIGNGIHEVLLFTDIDCPYCVRLEKAIDTNLRDDVTVRVMLYPIQGLHPNALDKQRHILSVPVEDRQEVAARIRGTNNKGLESKEVVGNLSNEELEALDKVISTSFTLGNKFNVVGTPTLMQNIDGALNILGKHTVILDGK